MKTKLLYLTLIILLASAPGRANAQTENMLPGAFIVNMGLTPQTFNNGLKPYGLVRDLVVNHQVPIRWAISQTKLRDGVDFVYNSVNYRGGPFVIPADQITPAVAARISYWQGQGVVGVYTTSYLMIPVYAVITNFPVIMIDTLSNLQSIIRNYYTLAGMDSTAYFLGAPAGLNECFDIWTNPHGDPTWATHGALHNFVTNIKGWIWGQCHAVSMMEDVVNPSPPNEQLNFLTNNGLKCWQSGSCGAGFTEFHALSATSPFSYFYPNDPEMQFMLDLHLATQAGSERWFHPISTGAWRPTTRVGVSTATGSNPNQGVLAVYGPAYGNTNYGRVMYVAGHDLTSGGGGVAIQHKVSAIRTYFNFMLLAGKARGLSITATMPPDSFDVSASYPVSASVTTGTPPFTYEWTSLNGGTFDNPTDSATNYHPPVTANDTFDVVKVKVTDLCGRVNFLSVRIRSFGYPALPVELVHFSINEMNYTNSVEWTTASEINNDYFNVERSSDGINFELIGKIEGAGNSITKMNYAWIDFNPLPGVSYYRLVQRDFDGAQKIYGPLSARRNETSAALTVAPAFPNPFEGDITISYSSPGNSATLIEMNDAAGNNVMRTTIDSDKGENSFRCSGFELAEGVYYITISQPDEKPVTTVVIKH